MDLPIPVSEYFKARNKFDVGTAIAHFDDAAIVKDEGTEYYGRDSIRAWIEETQKKYSPSFEVQSVQQIEGNLVVAVIVSGEFPGSPLQIDHAFVEESGKITRLVIS